MADETPGSSEKHAGRSLTDAITFAAGTITAYLANHFLGKDAERRELFTNLAPTVGLLTSFILNRAARQYYHWRGNRKLEQWIKKLLAERPNSNRTRQLAIDAEVAEYRAKLKQRRLDNLP
jgi:hypothetical protein